MFLSALRHAQNLRKNSEFFGAFFITIWKSLPFCTLKEGVNTRRLSFLILPCPYINICLLSLAERYRLKECCESFSLLDPSNFEMECHQAQNWKKEYGLNLDLKICSLAYKAHYTFITYLSVCILLNVSHFFLVNNIYCALCIERICNLAIAQRDWGLRVWVWIFSWIN